MTGRHGFTRRMTERQARRVVERQARRVVESPLEQERWQAYRQAKASHGTENITTWDAFFAWLEAAIPWTS